METGRGKKSKKAAWHLNLGLKEVIFAGIGIVGLMMMSFALGALAGRGDIYRAAYSWGLLNPEVKPVVQAIPPAAAVTPAPATTEAPAAAPAPAAPAVAPTAAAPTPVPPHANLATLPGGPAVKHEAVAPIAKGKAAHPTPIPASMTPLSPPTAAASSKKATRAAQAQREQKAREDQLRREHQEVASKLTFLNSFDTKTGLKKEKAAAKSQPAQVKVGTYRDNKTAQAKLAEMQKKGVKVTLKQGKDAKGAFYTLYRQSDNLAQKKEKAAGVPPKPRPE